MKIYSVRKLFLVFVLLLAADFSVAGDGGTGYVSGVHFMSGGQVLFHVSGPHDNPPSCPGLVLTRWAIDATTEAGKAQLSGVLAAYVAGKQIRVYGTGDCSVWGDTETVNYFNTSD